LENKKLKCFPDIHVVNPNAPSFILNSKNIYLVKRVDGKEEKIYFSKKQNLENPEGEKVNDNIIKCPKCGSQSRIHEGSMQTLACYPTIYDENGVIISKDGNISTHR
jgi:hypothetical protein